MSMKSTVRTDPSRGGRTKQEQASSCDVNVIVAQHKRGMISTHVINRVAEYGHVPSLDFREAMEQTRQARELFDAMPAATRKYFSNDPANFLEYIKDPKKREDLVEHKLLIPKPKAEPVLGSAENPVHTVAKATESGSGGNPR